MAAKRETDLHVRVCEEADAALDLMAEVQGKPRNQLASELLEAALLGQCHNLKLAAMRFARLGLPGTKGDS